MRLSEWHAAAPTPASLAARVDAVVVPVPEPFPESVPEPERS